MSRKRKRRHANGTSSSTPEALIAEGSGGVSAELEPILEVADDLERRQDEREAAEASATLDAAAEAGAPDEAAVDEMFADATIAEPGDADAVIAAADAEATDGDAADGDAADGDAADGASPGEALDPDAQAARAETEPAPIGDGDDAAADDEVALDGEDGEPVEGVAALPTSAAAMPAGQLKLLVEALVFASDKPMTVQRLRQLTRVSDTRRLEQALGELQDDHRERGIVLQQVSGGWQFRTATPWAPWVQQVIAGRPVRLTRAQLETLAIVAYRQPITRPEIDDIRGVDSSATLKLLMDRGLIRALGKKEEVGRPTLFGTTKEFLDFFSLGDLRELPTLREYSELTDESQRVVDDRLGGGRDAARAPTAEAEPPGDEAGAEAGEEAGAEVSAEAATPGDDAGAEAGAEVSAEAATPGDDAGADAAAQLDDGTVSAEAEAVVIEEVVATEDALVEDGEPASESLATDATIAAAEEIDLDSATELSRDVDGSALGLASETQLELADSDEPRAAEPQE